MATKLIKLADGTLVEAEVPDNEAEQISWNLAKKVNESFDRIEPLLVKVCKPIASAWDELNTEVQIEQAEVELGLSFEGEGNLYVTKATAGANLKVKLTFKPKRPQNEGGVE
jgi:hypothetical protein